MSTSNTTNASGDIKVVIAACAAISVFGLAFGMSYPLLSLILEQRGESTQLIGWNAAMMPIGILISSSILPRLTRRFETRSIAVAASLFTTLAVLAYPTFPSTEAWFVIRLLQGMAISTLFILSEAWIVGYSNKANRGRIVAIYSSVLSASFATGPAIISVTGVDGWAPFLAGAAILLIGTIPLFYVNDRRQPVDEDVRPGTFSFMSKAPMLLCCVAGFAVFDAATLSLLPIYSLRFGMDLSTATLTLTALIAGNVLLQFPIGWIADRYPRRPVLYGCAAITAALLMILPFSMNTPWMWPILLIAGTTGYGVYTVSLTDLGDRFSGQELIDGTAAFATMWGLGALFGSVFGGTAMGSFGPNGLPFSLALVYAILAIGLILKKPGIKKQNN